MDKKGITTSDALPIIAKNALQILIAGLTAIKPEWGMLFSTSSVIVNAWGDFGQTRVNELVLFISEHKEEFIADIIESDKFKTLFLNILERHMKESSEEKRQLLRNYLLNVGKGINPTFNEFTRMNNILDTITLEEIIFLRLWDTDQIIGKYLNQGQMHGHAMTISDIESCIYGMNPRDPKLVIMIDDTLGHFRTDKQSKNNQILISLSYKGLLYGLTQDNFGSGQEVRIKEITSFGKAFLDFIKV